MNKHIHSIRIHTNIFCAFATGKVVLQRLRNEETERRRLEREAHIERRRKEYEDALDRKRRSQEEHLKKEHTALVDNRDI